MRKMIATHIGQRGKKKGLRTRCNAKETCPFQSQEDHFFAASVKDVDYYNELLLTEQNDTLSSSQKKEKQRLEEASQEYYKKIAEPKEVRYSFLKDFSKIEQKFGEDFEGFPTRFFNADLIHKKDAYSMEKVMQDPENEERYLRYLDRSRTGQKLTQAVSEPKDFKTPTEEVLKTFSSLGFQLEEESPSQSALTWSKADRGWYVTKDGETFLVTDGSAGAKNFNGYYIRSEGKSFTVMDLRTLNGVSRIKRKTGIDFAEAITDGKKPSKFIQKNTGTEEDPSYKKVINENFDSEIKEYQANQAQKKRMLRDATHSLIEAQQEGTRFISQKKHIRESNGKIATVWMDKKHPDAEHVAMAKNSKLTQHFSKLEIDNDVDKEEFKSFQNDLLVALQKMPRIPKDRQPELRVRYLGQHKASGLFSPGHNTVAIDVRTSESTIHELGHYYDLVAKDSASMSGSFSEIVKDYGSDLKMPAGSGSSKAKANDPEYYKTPTEVFARGFEIYANEKLGVSGRVLRESKHDNFAYAPFQESPKLKERLFKFFEETFDSN